MTRKTTAVHVLSTTLLSAVLATALSPMVGCAPNTGSSLPTVAARPTDTASVEAGFVQVSERSGAYAVRMAELQAANGAREDIKAAARSMMTREAANLEMLARERARLGLPAAAAGIRDDAHMMFDVDRMATLSGEAADIFFVEHMIEQRRSMIDATLLSQQELRAGGLAVFARGLTGDLERDILELKSVQHAASVMPANSRGNKGTKGGLAPSKIKPK